MAEKKVIKVLIAGKVMTMSGYESEEYMQQVANYINNKIAEYDKADSFRLANEDVKHRILELNFADDYFKEKLKASELSDHLKEKINELEEMKHECVNRGVRIENLQKELEKLQGNLKESEKKIVELQSEVRSGEKQLAEIKDKMIKNKR
ncbi:MAG: cell division protein ZapA [Lachnospiraceae bacterium]|nr:cell division protein ZapA [Lachnospiraceae bacterium]